MDKHDWGVLIWTAFVLCAFGGLLLFSDSEKKPSVKQRVEELERRVELLESK